MSCSEEDDDNNNHRNILSETLDDGLVAIEDLAVNVYLDDLDIPDIFYGFYQNIIAISLFNHEAHIYCNSYNGENNIEEVEDIKNWSEKTRLVDAFDVKADVLDLIATKSAYIILHFLSPPCLLSFYSHLNFQSMSLIFSRKSNKILNLML